MQRRGVRFSTRRIYVSASKIKKVSNVNGRQEITINQEDKGEQRYTLQ
jgi:hypothetical protein